MPEGIVPEELEPEEVRRLEGLLRARWAALAVAVPGGGPPALSFVAFAPAPALEGLVLHLSELARHTRLLREAGTAALGLSEPDPGGGDPQRLARLTLEGPVELLASGDPRHEEARRAYLDRLPRAAPRFAFPDFRLFLLLPERARFVVGFGRALDLSPGTVLAAAGP